MKRVGCLWPEIVRFQNLLSAARSARKGKRFQPNVLRFEHDLEGNLLRIQRGLMEKTWTPGPYAEYFIHEPKTRKISAAPYADRVVHHALVRVIEPVFEKRFIDHSYACRKGKGTHRAVDVFQKFLRRYDWCLKMDIEKFFPSMDHAVLMDVIRRKIKCQDTLWLIETIISSSNPQEPIWRYFEGDDLFAPAKRRRGIPIGNLTSQFFANVMLDPLDHFVTERLRIGAYVRYCDDFALFSACKEDLAEAKKRIGDFLEAYRLMPHPKKCHVFPTRRGSPFLGYRVLKTHKKLLPDNVRRFRKRAKKMVQSFEAGSLTADKVSASLKSWIAHAEHAETYRLRERLFSDLVFTRRQV